jgi:hypothetical protein
MESQDLLIFAPNSGKEFLTKNCEFDEGPCHNFTISHVFSA